MDPALIVAAHGTRSAEGRATTRAIAAAVAARRPQVQVELAYLDVAEPSLGDALRSFGGRPSVVVPLLLGAGYHVQTDIPAIAAEHGAVRVAQHLGADPAVVEAVADRLAEVTHRAAAHRVARSTVLAAIGSTRESARAEHAAAAAALAERLARPVTPLPLTDHLAADLAALPDPIEVAVYLLAEGGFLAALHAAMAGRGVVAGPIGAHPALVSLVWARYDAAVR